MNAYDAAKKMVAFLNSLKLDIIIDVTCSSPPNSVNCRCVVIDPLDAIAAKFEESWARAAMRL